MQHLGMESSVGPVPSHVGGRVAFIRVVLSRLPDRRVVSNVKWTFTGNALYALSQWAMVVVLARFTDPQTVGTLALAFAITAPVVIFFNMQLRAVVATDVTGHYGLRDYLRTRLFTTAAALLVTLIFLPVLRQSATTVWVIVLVALSKGAESLSDIVHGHWQLIERMDLVGRSLTLRALLTLTTFTVTVVLTRDVVWGSVAFLAGSLGVFLSYDLRRVAPDLDPLNMIRHPLTNTVALLDLTATRNATLRAIVRLALPLGCAAMLISLNTAIPRYFIEANCGKRQLGIFAALSYFIVVGNLSMNAVGQSLLPRLAKLYRLHSRAEFRRLLTALLVCSALVAIGSMTVSLMFGRRLLQIYGNEYANAYPVFLVIMGAASVGYFLSVFNFSLNAIAAYKVQMPLFLAVTLALTVLCKVLIPKYGLPGAAGALLAAGAIQGAISGLVLMWQAQTPCTQP